ncbi:MAG TPA: hypothetical protein DHV36_05805 [Desulfobacteraceae bacterium]|nr:hypothetical protein [Desulfobacteraceae bacterium]
MAAIVLLWAATAHFERCPDSDRSAHSLWQKKAAAPGLSACINVSCKTLLPACCLDSDTGKCTDLFCGTNGKKILRWQKINLPPVFAVSGVFRPWNALDKSVLPREALYRNLTPHPVPIYKLTLAYLC